MDYLIKHFSMLQIIINLNFIVKLSQFQSLNFKLLCGFFSRIITI